LATPLFTWLSLLLPVQVARDAEAAKKGATARSATQPDDLIDFVQLKAKKGLSQIEIEDEVTTGGWMLFGRGT
jgi:coatomer subunit beta